MYLPLFVVALIVERVSGFQGFPVPTSIFGSKPVVDVEAGLHLPKTILGNKLMVGNTIFLDSNLLPIHDSMLKIGGISDLDSKILLLKKLIDPSFHPGLTQYEHCPITGQKLSKLDHFKKLFTLVDCDSDHFKKLFQTLPFTAGAVNAHKLLETIGGGVGGVGLSNIIPSVVCEDEKKKLFGLLQLFAPNILQEVTGTSDWTGALALHKVAEFKKLLVLISLIKPELLHSFVQSQCSTLQDIHSKELLDVKEFDDKFKIVVHVGPLVTKEEDVSLFFDKEKKLHIKTSLCSKTIPLPSHIDISKTESILHEGTLVVSVPKVHPILGEEVVSSVLGAAECKLLGGLMGEGKHPIKVNVL